MQKIIFFTDLPTLFFPDHYKKQTISFFRPYVGIRIALCSNLKKGRPEILHKPILGPHFLNIG